MDTVETPDLNNVPHLAVYDFDGTVCKGDTLPNFWKWSLKTGVLRAWGLLPTIPFLFILRMFRLISWDRFKELFIWTFLTPSTVQARMQDFWHYAEENLLFPWVKKRIQADRDQGLYILCTSAGTFSMMTDFVQSLGFDAFIATPFSLQTLRYTGEQNIRQHKVTTLKDWAASQDIDQFIVQKMYTDSINDKPLLDIAVEEYWVMKDGTLLRNHPNTRCCCRF